MDLNEYRFYEKLILKTDKKVESSADTNMLFGDQKSKAMSSEEAVIKY